MNEQARILYICQEVVPYLPQTRIANLCRFLPQAMQERGAEIRIFMPKWGSINERRNQLHEVIRLSGMNLIIDDTDHQLIIKVASIPSARVQVYFIDNDDFFRRKATWVDPDTKKYFDDNEERAIFFARGVLETVKKLGWSPNIVHCHDWFSAMAPIYLRQVFHKEPIFKELKIVVSVYDHPFPGSLNKGLRAKLMDEGIGADVLEGLATPDHRHLMQFAIEQADGVVIGSEGFGQTPQTKGLMEYIDGIRKGKGKKLVLDYPGDGDDGEGYVQKYEKFYAKLLK